MNFKSLFIKDFHFKEIIYNASSNLVIRFISIIFSFIFTYCIATQFGSNVLGILALYQSILFILSVFCRLGLDTASVRFVTENIANNRFTTIKDIFKKLTILVSIISFIVSFIFYVFFNRVAGQFLKYIDFNDYIIFVTLSIVPFSLLLVNSEFFRGFKKINYYAIFRQLSLPIISCLILFICILLKQKNNFIPVFSYTASIYCLLILSYFFIFNIILKNLSKTKDKESKSSYKDLLKISIPMMITNSLLHLLQYSDIIILGIFTNDSNIGIYNIAYKVAMLTSLSLFAVNSIAAPKISELYHSNKMQEFKQTISFSSKITFFASLPIVIIFLFFPEQILIFFGNEYVKGKWVLIILSLGQFVNCIAGPAGYILQMTGKEKVFKNIIIFSVFINVALNFILVPFYGILGASLSSLFSLLISSTCSLYIIYKDYNVKSFYLPFCNESNSDV